MGEERRTKEENLGARRRRGAQPHSQSRPARGVASIAELLKDWLKESKAPQRLSEESIFARWKDVVGEEIAARTRVVEARQGELVVEVNSSALLNELSTYYRDSILDSLRQTEEFRSIHMLKFRAGSFEDAG